jgi:hypothetical protein
MPLLMPFPYPYPYPCPYNATRCRWNYPYKTPTMQKGYYQAPCLNFDEKEVVYPADEVCAAWISNRRTTFHIRCHVPFLCPVFTVFPLCFLFLGLRPSITPQSNAMFITSRLSVNAVFQPKSECWVPWLGPVHLSPRLPSPHPPSPNSDVQHSLCLCSAHYSHPPVHSHSLLLSRITKQV